MKFKVTMVCKEIARAVVIVEHHNENHEDIKDKAWAKFDKVESGNLEQENYTKVVRIVD